MTQPTDDQSDPADEQPGERYASEELAELLKRDEPPADGPVYVKFRRVHDEDQQGDRER